MRSTPLIVTLVVALSLCLDIASGACSAGFTAVTVLGELRTADQPAVAACSSAAAAVAVEQAVERCVATNATATATAMCGAAAAVCATASTTRCFAASASATVDCVCSSGFTGATCDAANLCEASPCANGGTCVLDGSCECPVGFSGPSCSTAAPVPSASTSTEPQSCLNGGTVGRGGETFSLSIFAHDDAVATTGCSASASSACTEGTAEVFIAGAVDACVKVYGPAQAVWARATRDPSTAASAITSSLVVSLYNDSSCCHMLERSLDASLCVSVPPTQTLSALSVSVCETNQTGFHFTLGVASNGLPYACACPPGYSGHYCELEQCTLTGVCAGQGECSSDAVASPDTLAYTAAKGLELMTNPNGGECPAAEAVAGTPWLYSAPLGRCVTTLANGDLVLASPLSTTFSAALTPVLASLGASFTGAAVSSILTAPRPTTTTAVACCPLNMYGPTCADTDACLSSPCPVTISVCSRSASTFECLCAPGYIGAQCDATPCTSSPCMHGATCDATTTTAYTCQCAPGFTGTLCETDIEECATSPCRFGGTCSEPPTGGFVCTCTAGFTSADCSRSINECDSSPCTNGGNCLDRSGFFECSCKSGFTGTICDMAVSECDSNPCGVGGTCVDLASSFSCSCAPGYTGVLCNINPDTECASSPCQNGATCVNLPLAFACTCPASATGELCETLLPSAASSSSIVPIVIGVVAGVLFLIVLVLAIVLVREYRHKHKRVFHTGSSASNATAMGSSFFSRASRAALTGNREDDAEQIGLSNRPSKANSLTPFVLSEYQTTDDDDDDIDIGGGVVPASSSTTAGAAAADAAPVAALSYMPWMAVGAGPAGAPTGTPSVTETNVEKQQALKNRFAKMRLDDDGDDDDTSAAAKEKEEDGPPVMEDAVETEEQWLGDTEVMAAVVASLNVTFSARPTVVNPMGTVALPAPLAYAGEVDGKRIVMGALKMEGRFTTVHQGGLRLDGVRAVLVRALKPGCAGSAFETAFTEFRDELEILEQCHHANVCNVLGRVSRTVLPSGWRVLLEHPLSSLVVFLRGARKWPERDQCAMALQVAYGLHHVHQQGFVHRNVGAVSCVVMAPTNETNGECVVKLSGFELCMAIERGACQQDEFVAFDLPQAGRLAPSHAPEMKMPTLESTPRSDVFMFGWLLWEISAACHEPPPVQERPFPTFIPEHCGDSLATLLVDCLAGSPRRRPPLDEVVTRLETMCQHCLESST